MNSDLCDEWQFAGSRNHGMRRGARVIGCLSFCLGLLLASDSFAQLGYGVNTTFDAASGADDATPGDGFCETATGNNVCTLRAAIQEANAYSATHGGVTNVIGFNLSPTDPNYNGIFWTINLAAALPDLTSNMSMNGPGSGKLSVKRNSAALFRIFTVTSSGTVSISGLTLANGNVGAGGTGGDISHSTGILNLTNCVMTGGFAKNGGSIINSSGSFNFTGCTIDNNSAGNRGGAIQNFGTATFKNCTLSNNFNTAANDGGAIDNLGGTLNLTNSTLKGNSSNQNGGAITNSATISVSNCTITGNHAAMNGGGIYSSASTTNVKSSIIALNTANGSGPDVSGLFTPQGFNLIGKNDGAPANFPAGNPNANNDIVGTSAAPIDPLLDTLGLQNNGGPTLTIALLANSPALDKGTSIASTGALTTDQRGAGYTRTVNLGSVANAAGGDGTDVGAVEFGVTISLISIARSGTDIVITFQGSAGATYRLERKDLADPGATWLSVSGVNDLTANSNGPVPITHPDAVPLGKVFYRVRLL